MPDRVFEHPAPLPNVRLKTLTAEHTLFLREMTFEAVYFDSPRPDIDVAMANQDYMRYYASFGSRSDDTGVIMADLGGPLGAAWCRRYREEHRLDEQYDGPPIPEVSVALRSAARNRGYGTMMLQAVMEKAAAKGEEQLIAQVHKENIASRRSCQKSGFEAIGDNKNDSDYLILLVSLDSA